MKMKFNYRVKWWLIEASQKKERRDWLRISGPCGRGVRAPSHCTPGGPRELGDSSAVCYSDLKTGDDNGRRHLRRHIATCHGYGDF